MSTSKRMSIPIVPPCHRLSFLGRQIDPQQRNTISHGEYTSRGPRHLTDNFSKRRSCCSFVNTLASITRFPEHWFPRALVSYIIRTYDYRPSGFNYTVDYVRAFRPITNLSAADCSLPSSSPSLFKQQHHPWAWLCVWPFALFTF